MKSFVNLNNFIFLHNIVFSDKISDVLVKFVVHIP